MAILHDCEIWFAKLDPAHPNNRYNKENPTWEVQLRTKSKEQKAEWEALGIKVVAHREDDDGPVLYYRANLRKKSKKADGEDGSIVGVIDGECDPVDPNTIGNGSIANIRIYQYNYSDAESGKSGKATVLMGVQLTKHIVYTPKPREDEFKKAKTERVVPADEDAEAGEDFKKTPKVDAEEVY